MSKLNQIKTKLQEIDQANFQKLCDQYWHYKGYEKINPLGVMIGADKVVKGTPDTLITLPNGKYIFAEYTTQQSGVCAKFMDDLAKCFDEAKTGIPVEKIECLILCHNSRLKPEEINTLVEECQKHGCNLELVGIGPLSHDLYQKFPGIARDYLSVEVDSGQIVFPTEFVTAYNKSALATPLDTAFRFRENEMAQILTALEANDLVIISGKAGVGKSRLALQGIASFAKANPEFSAHCIFNRSVDLFEDIRVYFTPPGNHLIFVDDANRVSGFEYVLQLLHAQNQERKVKVVVTVRDYALEKVREKALPYGGGAEVILETFTDEQISQLVSEEYEIRNQVYLARISDIAKGNPRLAIMAARVAVRENTLQSINDVSALYDEYFSTIRRELEELHDQSLLKVAGFIAFFRAVDRTNDELMQAIKDAFGITPEDFWSGAQRLHELEVVDMYENEVVRTSDQVLATYFFYLAFFKDQVLSFGALLESFFPRYRHKIVDALNPLLSAFDGKALSDQMRQHVTATWERLKKSGKEEELLQLMQLFWFLKETDILLYLNQQIAALHVEPVPESELNFKADANFGSPSILSLLSALGSASVDSVRMATDLLLDYLAKRPKDLPYVLHLLTENFGFHQTSHLTGFEAEKTVINTLWKRAQESACELFKPVYLTVAEYYLRTHFTRHESKSQLTVSIIQFDLPATPALFALRHAIWQGLFTLYRLTHLRKQVLELLRTYCLSGYLVSKDGIIQSDAEQVLPFIAAELDSEQYDHCLVVQSYLKFLKRHKVPFEDDLKTRFRNKIYVVTELLLDDRECRASEGWERHKELKEQRIKQHFARYSFDDYQRFFNECAIIKAHLRHGHEDYIFRNGIMTVLLSLTDTNPGLFVQVMEQYLASGNSLAFDSHALVTRLIAIQGAAPAYEILAQHEYQFKMRWLFAFFEMLPPAEITPDHLKQLFDLYQTTDLESYPHSLEFLTKYLPFDENVFVRVTEAIVMKTQQDSRYGYCLTNLFNPYADACKGLREFFAASPDVLKGAYFAAQQVRDHADFSGAAFNAILDLDRNFAEEYIEWLYSRDSIPSRFDDTRDYEFLWKRDDYEELMTNLIARIYQIEQDRQLLWYSYSQVFFQRNGDQLFDEEVETRQNMLLSKLIEQHKNNFEFVSFLFGVISNFSYDRRRHFVEQLLKYNRRFDDFTKLQLEPSSWSYVGSEVPMLQERAEFYESLLPLLNTVDLLKHRQYVEQGIQQIKDGVERAKKHDFMRE